MTDWTRVNKVIEQMTGKPTPTRAEISAKVEAMIAQLHSQQGHSVHQGFCYTCQKWL